MNIKAPLIMESVFILIAGIVYFITGNDFFIFNFLFIGTAIAMGIFLIGNGHEYGRNLIMLVVGSYLLFYVSILGHESLSLSGFWYYLFLGVFEAAVIHFLIAKIAGPFLFGRGWCGYACWTAMIFDLLPYKTPNHERKNWGYFRYVLFVAILCFVVLLFIFKMNNLDEIIFYTFLAGNILYYIVGVALAYHLKDNRAFCKYVCPITVFFKFTSYFSLLRVTVNNDKCNVCGKCIKNCPMDVDMLNNSRKRENGTECILCLRCIHDCPNNALKL
ncbi:4Fe-4S binding protein [Methanobrevibacter sp.]|uniref:4Fe-4S binding protein n=1 Tax=Methanobrevibacter sp. TaxID=66852 RepID=UPI0038646618